MRSKSAIVWVGVLGLRAALGAGPLFAARVAPLIVDATTQRIIVNPITRGVFRAPDTVCQ
jgi:hypothetical protein